MVEMSCHSHLKMVILHARSEQTVFAKSKIESAMLDFEFAQKFSGINGVYITRARDVR